MIHSEKKIQDCFQQKNFSQALEWLQENLKADPEEASSWYLLGVCHYLQGNLQPTLQALQKALQYEPHHTHAALCLSVLFNDLGRYQEAQTLFERANQSLAEKDQQRDQEVDRKFAVKHLELADLYLRYRRYEEAIEHYSQAIRLDPSDWETRLRRAKAQAKKGATTEAFAELQSLKAEAPDSLPARLQLGLLYWSQGHLLEAELEWETLLQLHPENEEARSYLEEARRNKKELLNHL